MLHALREYARSHELEAEPGFKVREIRWLITFSEAGQFLGVLRQGDGKSGRLFDRCPHLSQPEIKAGGAGCRHFLVDGLDVLVLLTKDGRIDEKLRQKHAYFVGLLEQAGESMPVLKKIAAFLRDETSLEPIREQLAAQTPKARANDLATFAVSDAASGRTEVLVESDLWHDWWRGFRATLDQKRKGKRATATRKSTESSGSGTKMLCLLSGEPVDPMPTHPKISGLADVGGMSAGDVLASFKQESFCSYGLSQAANAAMSEQMATVCATALDDLIRNRSVRLAGVKLVYWYLGRSEVPKELDPVAIALGESPWGGIDYGGAEVAEQSDAESSSNERTVGQAERAAKSLLEAIQTAKRGDLLDYRYRAMVLSGNSGRVVVRDWMEGRFEELAKNVDSWFEDLAINFVDSMWLARPIRFESLLTCCLLERPPGQKYEDWVKPVGPHRQPLWRAALGGSTVMLPKALVERAVRAHVATLLSHRFIINPPQIATEAKTAENRPAYRRSTLISRMALLRAYCVRYARNNEQGDLHVESALKVDHPRGAYQIGRLMAVLEMIQRRAQGELGATIAQTHYASAATRPLAALPRLQTLVQHHLPKIDPPRLRDQYQNLLTEINHRIHHGIPRSFDLEDQCLFHLGYYHQRAYQPYAESPQRHSTLSGYKVRSKSEVVIANLLTFLGIEFKYEEPLCFDSKHTIVPGDRKDEDGIGTIRPDFMVLNSRFGKPVFIEHTGMMDNLAYRSDWKERLNLYRKLGILKQEEGDGPNGVLIETTERNGTIDCQELKQQLEAIG